MQQTNKLKELTLEEVAKLAKIKPIGVPILLDFYTGDRNFGYPDMKRERKETIPRRAPKEANAFSIGEPFRVKAYTFVVAVQYYRID